MKNARLEAVQHQARAAELGSTSAQEVAMPIKLAGRIGRDVELY